jgi:type III pantothenate kinase
MFLSIDAGNSNIVFGLYDEQSGDWVMELRVDTKKSPTAFEIERKIGLYFLENGMKPTIVSAIGFSSVVPELNSVIFQFCRRFFDLEPYSINGESYRKLLVSTQKPDEIGSDLMANITAAYYKYRQACIVVDFGTALTFTVADESGSVIGVNIVPGIKTAIYSLFANTAKLPQVTMEMPSSSLGKDTVHSIQAGIFYGYTGLVRGMLQAIREETQKDFKIIATGGMASLMTQLKDNFDAVDRNLTLEGIRMITKINMVK